MSTDSALNTVGAIYVFECSSGDPAAQNLSDYSTVLITQEITPTSYQGVTYIPAQNSAFSIKLAKQIVLDHPENFQICLISAIFVPPIDGTNSYSSSVYVYSNITGTTVLGSSNYSVIGVIPPPSDSTSTPITFPATYKESKTVPTWLPIAQRDISVIELYLYDYSGNPLPPNNTEVTTFTYNPATGSPPSPPPVTFSLPSTLTFGIRRIRPDV